MSSSAHSGVCDKSVLHAAYLPAEKLHSKDGLRFAEHIALNGSVLSPRIADAGARVVLFEGGTLAIGTIAKVIGDDVTAYIGFDSATKLMSADENGAWVDLPGQGYDQHEHGYGMAVGTPQGTHGEIATFTADDWARLGIKEGSLGTLKYKSGVLVRGKVAKLQTDATGLVRVIKFVDADVTLGPQVLFRPEWGDYDLLIGTQITNSMLKP